MKLKFTVLIIIFTAILIGSFIFGRYAISLSDLIKIMTNKVLYLLERITGGSFRMEQTWRDEAEIVAIHIRTPRVIAAAIIGAALSTAGAAYQGMFRNPMVSPDILGASTGAGFGAALGIFFGFRYAWLILSSFCFGLAAVGIAYLISRASKLGSMMAMVLAGIMVGSLFQAGTSYIKLVADTTNQLPAITYWLMGSLNSAKGGDTLFVSVIVIAGLCPLILLRWRINILTISEDEAKSLGINTRRLRLVVIICATLITAASVSISGMIGWVGLVIPHFCRLIFGDDYKRLIPASIFLGASFMMLVDNFARLVTTGEIPLGILTAFVGAPVFVWLILRGGAAREDRS